MTLVIDDRVSLGNNPGLHALLVGVSLYPHLPGGGGVTAEQHFGMGQLRSPALTAYRLYQWLKRRNQNLPVPLATCRLLLSPSPEEIAVEPALANFNASSTWKNFSFEAKAWRTDAANCTENQTLFYFGGHGVQRSRTDPIMLSHEFGDAVGGTLTRGVALNNIFNAMAPSASYPSIARTQFYFVDACRVQPESFKEKELLSVPDLMDVDIGGIDNRCAPIFYASVAGATAYALDCMPTLFGLALLDALERDAADLRVDDTGERWVVTSHSLDRALKIRLAELNRQWNSDQDAAMSGIAGDAEIHRLDGPPVVDITLEIEPAEALTCTTVRLEDPASNTPACQVPIPISPYPFRHSLAAGFYRLSATIDPPTPQYIAGRPRIVEAKPPGTSWKVRVSK
jgi:hypothetical protein